MMVSYINLVLIKVMIPWVMVIVFNATCNNISVISWRSYIVAELYRGRVISWRSVLLVEESVVPEKKHNPYTIPVYLF